MNRIIRNISTLLLVLFISSCMSDDYSSCPPGYAPVRVTYDWSALETRAATKEDVNSIDLYIFDSAGLLVTWVSDDHPEAGNEAYYMEVILPYGTYDVVAWVNAREEYVTEPETMEQGNTLRNQAKLALQIPEDGIVQTPLHPLLYGAVNGLQITENVSSVDAYVPVTLSPVLNTNTLNLTITGGEAGETYQLAVIDSNSSYYFDNTIAPGEELHYITSLAADEEEKLVGTLVVGQLDREREPRLVVTSLSSLEAVYEASLMALILREETEENPIDLQQRSVYDLAVDITRRPEDPVVVQVGFSWAGIDPAGREGIRPEEVHRVDLFVFDQEGLFIEHWTDNPLPLTSSYRLQTELPAGEYSFIAWFNLEENYRVTPELPDFVVGQTRLADARITLAQVEGVAGVTAGSPLLYGAITDRMVNNLFAGADGCQQIQLTLTQNTYELSLTLKGELSDSGYRLEMRDTHGRYDFENSFALSREEIWYATTANPSGEGIYKGYLTVERLERGRQPWFYAKTQTGKVLYESSLVDLILEYETVGGWIDFSKVYRFDLELEFTENNDGSFAVEVTINGWKVKEEEGELG